MEVKTLDSDLKENIRSGYCINNVTQCINELVLNSLDANSSHIAVRVNLTSFRIQIVDDGEGITESNLEHIGKRNYTNKCHSTSDLEKVRKQFGFKGESLSSIANNAKVIKIITRPWDAKDSQTCGKTFQKTIEGKNHTIEETTQRASGGTTVTIQEFMYNLPVRQKCTKNLAVNDIKTNLQRLFILHPNVTFSLRDDSTKKILFSTTTVDTVEAALRQQIDNLEENLVKYYMITRGRTIVKILIYLKQYENSKWQMFYVNKLPIKSARLTSFVNEILSKSALGVIGGDKKVKNKVKSFSAGNFLYLINIALPNSKYQVVNFDEVEFKNLDSILKVIEKQLRKILEKEKLFLPEPEKKKKIECNLERRIHLSGFPGAFKASAVKKKGDQVVDEDIHDFVYNPDYEVNNVTDLGNNDSNGNGIGIEKSVSIVDKPIVMTPYSSTTYSDAENNQGVFSMNVDAPFETTSTIGKKYVLNKFFENNQYNERIHPPKLKQDVIGEHLKEMRKRKYLEELAAREAFELDKEKVRRIEIQRAREAEKEMEALYVKRNVYDRFHNVMDYHNHLKLYEEHKNDAALANYYRYKHEQRPKPNKRRQQAKETKECQQFFWDDRKIDLFNPPELFPITSDFKILPKEPGGSYIPKFKVPIDEFKPRYEKQHPHKKSLYPHKICYDYRKMEHKNMRKPPEYLPKLNIAPIIKNPTYNHDNFVFGDHDDWKNVLNFEELDKKSFHFPFDCTRTTKQVHNFAKTVYDLDFSSCEEFPHLLPKPEQRRKHDIFFRMRASEKTTRLKQFNHIGNRKNKMKINCRTKTTTIINSNMDTVYPNSNSRPGRRTKTKTLISYSRKTTVTSISPRNHGHGEKLRNLDTKKKKSLKQQRYQHRNLRNVSTKQINRRKVRYKSNKATNTSLRKLQFEQCVHQLDETLVMMEQSIQCTISNYINQEEESKRKENLIELVDDYLEKDIVTERKEPKINVIRNVIVKPIQDPNITSNKNYYQSNDSNCYHDDKEQPKQDDSIGDNEIIEGTPCSPPFTPWNSHFHPCTLKIKRANNSFVNLSSFLKEDEPFANKDNILVTKTLTQDIEEGFANCNFAGVEVYSGFKELPEVEPFANKDTIIVTKTLTQDIEEDIANFNFAGVEVYSGLKEFPVLEEFKDFDDFASGKDESIKETPRVRRDDSMLFNLSTAIRELAEEWSFNVKTTSKTDIINGEKNIFADAQNSKELRETIDCTTTNQSKTKKPITGADIFGEQCLGSNLEQLENGEWSRRINDQGGSYYVNIRTGNTMSQLPTAKELFDLARRPIDLPKGFSQVLKETPHITEIISADTKREFHAAVCESYNDDNLDLAHIKWKKNYLQSTDYEEFFKRIYDKRYIIEAQELQLPHIRQALNAVVFTKEMFLQLDVLNQYDHKFIVAVWKPRAMIVIFDQHAVHERVRLQQLLKKYIQVNKGVLGQSTELTSTTLKSFKITCNQNTNEICGKYTDVFKKFGLDLTCSADPADDNIMVNSVPECLFNKALKENSRRKEKLVELTKALISEIVNSIVDAACFKQWMPPLVINIINSEACRGAVMFGDVLSIEECETLVKDLSACDLPFHCAHGRPTCAPLFELTRFAEGEGRINLARLKRYKKKQK